MKYKGVMIADIHFGALPVERLYNELEIFLDFIEKKSLDFIVILGDWFDKKINLNSKDAKYSTVFFERICQICIDNDIKLRIIQGTESHDNSQLEVLEILAKNKPVDFKVFYEVEEEEFVAVMGPSGSGKTTLLNIIATVDEPTYGGVWIDGIQPERL